LLFVTAGLRFVARSPHFVQAYQLKSKKAKKAVW